MNAWEVLGLSRAEARDPATVKRAYAKQLKAHRPDRDPEGFRRVHDAYQALTGPMARWILQDDQDEAVAEAAPAAVAASTVETSGPPGPPPQDPQDRIDTPPLGTPTLIPAVAPVATQGSPSAVTASPAPATRPAIPSALDRAWRRLEGLLARDGQPGEAEVVGAARDILQVVPDRLAAGRRIAALLAGRPSVLAGVLDLDLLIALAVDGESEPLFTVAEHLHQRGDPRLRTLAESVAAAPDLRHEGMLHFRLGMLVATDHPMTGRVLADLAFASMPTHLRGLLDQLDLRLRMGSELERWPAELRRAWFTALDEEDMPKQHEQALRARIARLPESSAVRHAAATTFPGLKLPPTKEERERRRESRGGVSGTRWAWIVLVAVLVLGRMASCSKSSDPEPQARIPERNVPSATRSEQFAQLQDAIFKQIKAALLRGDQRRIHHWFRPVVINQGTGLSTTAARPAVLERILQDAEIPFEQRRSCAEWVRTNGDASFHQTAVKFLSAPDVSP